MYLGQLTHEANTHVTPSGVIRDSSPIQGFRKRRKKCKRVKRQVEIPKSVYMPRPTSGGMAPLWRMPAPRGGGRKALLQPKPLKVDPRWDKAKTEFEAAGETSFQSWWRESRSQSLRPADVCQPSAKQRLEALKARVAAKGGGACGSGE